MPVSLCVSQSIYLSVCLSVNPFICQTDRSIEIFWEDRNKQQPWKHLITFSNALEVHRKHSAMYHTFNSLLGVWNYDQTLSWVSGISLLDKSAKKTQKKRHACAFRCYLSLMLEWSWHFYIWMQPNMPVLPNFWMYSLLTRYYIQLRLSLTWLLLLIMTDTWWPSVL